MKIRTGIIALLFLLIVFVLSLSLSPRMAPAVVFTSINGDKIELKKLKGKPVIVTFWATDCASCIQEIPHLIALYQQFHPQGLEIIAVAMAYDPPNHVISMTKAKQIPYSVALDIKGNHAHAFGNVQWTPTTFLISPTGAIVIKKTGLLDITDMQQRIKNFL